MLLNIVLLTTLHINFVFSTKIHDLEQESTCNNKITNVTNKYFYNNDCITIIDMHKYTNDQIYQNKKPKIISKLLKTAYHPKECPFLITVPKLQTLYKYIFRTKQNIFMNPQNKFIIHLENTEPTVDIEEFLGNIWEGFRTPHILIIDNNCILYKFNPFEYSHNLWGHLKGYNYTNISVSDKILNLNGYPIKTIVFSSIMARKIYENNTIVQYGGIDGLFLSEILTEKMNFTAVVLPKIPKTYYGYRMTNGQFCGALKPLLDKQIEFIITSYFIKDYKSTQIEFSSVALTDELCIIVRKGSRIHYWYLSFIYCKIWLLLLASFILIATVWLLILQCETEITQRNNHRFCVFSNTFRLMLANPFPRKIRIFSERIFLISCMLAMMILLVAFQGYLVKFFTAPARYPEIKTLAELADTNFEIYTGFFSLKEDVFASDENPIMQKLKERILIRNKRDSVFYNRVLQGRAAEFMRKSELYLDHESRYFDDAGEDILYVVDECPRSYSLAYILPRKSAFAPRINTLILRASQAGFFSKWYADMARNTTLSTRRSRLDQIAAADQSKHKKFSIEDLIMGFYVIIIGHAISGFVLICEIGHYIIRKKLRARKK